MAVNVVNPFSGGGYTTPRHMFIKDSRLSDISDGHVAHPSGDPRYGLVNGQPVGISSVIPAVAVANGGRVG